MSAKESTGPWGIVATNAGNDPSAIREFGRSNLKKFIIERMNLCRFFIYQLLDSSKLQKKQGGLTPR